jgi:hypothetical protein
MLQADCHLLKEYPQELVDELIPVDQDFYHNVINAVDALSAIRIDDIRVKNTFNVTTIQHFDKDASYWASESKEIKKDLTISDFMGYYGESIYGKENSFVEGFTDVIYSNDLKAGKDLQTIAKENEELLKALLHGSEFEMKKYQPLVELSSCLFSAETCGLYSIETVYLGYDTITKERLTEDEKSIRAITGTLSFVTLLMGWGQAGGVAEGVVIYISMAAADSAQIATAYGCEQLGAPPLVTALISTTVGMGVGALSFKVGNTYAKPYDAGNSGVFDGIDKDATFPKYENKGGSGTKAEQLHHFATNKNTTYTPQFEKIASKYDLDLDDAWNKEYMPHQGRHPNEYHEYVLDNMIEFDKIAQGDKNIFLKLYEKMKVHIIDNPDMLYKDYWR